MWRISSIRTLPETVMCYLLLVNQKLRKKTNVLLRLNDRCVAIQIYSYALIWKWYFSPTNPSRIVSTRGMTNLILLWKILLILMAHVDCWLFVDHTLECCIYFQLTLSLRLCNCTSLYLKMHRTTHAHTLFSTHICNETRKNNWTESFT